MKAKLIKDHADYHLVDDKQFIIGTTDKRMISCTDKHKLSLKNCQAIERGYDLDELADEFAKTKSSHITFQNTHKRDFREGFQKALKILGDKKFTFDQMLLLAGYVVGLTIRSKSDPSLNIKQETLDFIDKMEQTEWDVVVEMEYYDPLPPTRQTSLRPKLDADGCLILKRV